MKYKVGDYVRVKEYLTIGVNYGRCSFVEGMSEYVGNVYKINCEISDGVYVLRDNKGKILIDECNIPFVFSSWMLEPSDNKTQHVNVLQGDVPIKTIIGNNNTVVTMLKDNDGKVIARGKAKCMKEDTFNLPFGVLLSMFRCFKHYGKFLNAEQYAKLINEVVEAFDYKYEYKFLFEDAPEKEYTMDFKEEPTEDSCDKEKYEKLNSYILKGFVDFCDLLFSDSDSEI